MSSINIKINDDLNIENVNEIIEHISSIRADDFNEKEWLVSVYNNLKSNKALKNTNKIILAARNKLEELGIVVDKDGNFNTQTVSVVLNEPVSKPKIIIREEPQKIVSKKVYSPLKSEYEVIKPYDDKYLYVYKQIVIKQQMGTPLTKEDIETQKQCLKRMIIELPEKGYLSDEYFYLNEYIGTYIDDYYRDRNQLSNFVKELIKDFLQIDSIFKFENTRKKGNTLKKSYKSGLVSVIVLLEIAVLGIFTLMIIS